MTISQGRTGLYRVFDATGKLLYIGISQNPDVRFSQHSQIKDWWRDVVERRVEWHPSRKEAELAEKTAIQTEKPHWNINHATRPLNNPEAERLYAEHRWNLEEARALLPEVRERAAEDLQAGSTPAELAKLTGLSDEFFRRIARSVGAERKREPTVGREAEAKRAGKEPSDG